MKSVSWLSAVLSIAICFACVPGFGLALSAASADEGPDYFDQFKYQKEVFDDGDGEIFVQYRWLQASQELELDKNHHLIANSSLFLLDDNKYVFRYRELHKVRDSETSEWRYDLRDFCGIEKKGEWNVSEGALMISEIGKGEEAIVSEQHAVQFTFESEFMTPAVKGTSTVFQYGYSNQSMEEIETPFCP